MPALHIFKIKPIHQQNLVKLVLYANQLYRRKLVRTDNCENIPLTNFYKALPASHRPLVKIAFNIFFKQRCRGNSISKKTSLWVRRNKPRLNGQIAKLVKDLKDDNTESITEMIKIATSKSENVVLITQETTIKFRDEESQHRFLSVIQALVDAEEVV